MFQIAPNRKEIGVAFKKEAKAVTDYLEAMSECDALELKAKLKAGSGTITVDKQVCRARFVGLQRVWITTFCGRVCKALITATAPIPDIWH